MRYSVFQRIGLTLFVRPGSDAGPPTPQARRGRVRNWVWTACSAPSCVSS